MVQEWTRRGLCINTINTLIFSESHCFTFGLRLVSDEIFVPEVSVALNKCEDASGLVSLSLNKCP
jgi:hypothetical protein